jgi:hypothetical protein
MLRAFVTTCFIHVEIDHEHKDAEEKPKYPMGWPSVTKEYKPSIDLPGYNFLELDIYRVQEMLK